MRPVVIKYVDLALKARRVCANFAALSSVGISPPLNPYRKGLLHVVLQGDGVIAYPTEGVWGLGCLPDSRAAVMRLLALKRRCWKQGLLIVAGHIDQLGDFLEGLDDTHQWELDQNWPGPVTYLVPDNGSAPRWIVGEHSTVGLRVTDHPLVRELCSIAGPLVSTSANISSRPAAMTALGVRRYFQNQIDYLVPGDLGKRGHPSEIRMLTTGEVLR